MVAWVAETVLVTALMAGMVALVGRWGRLGPSAQYALWMIVLMKFLMPPIVHWPWTPARVNADFRSIRVQTPTTPIPYPPLPSPPKLSRALAPPEPAPAPVRQPAPTTLSTPPARPRIEPFPSWTTLISWTLGLWVIGSVSWLGVQTARIFQFQKQIARAKPAPGWLVEEWKRLAQRMGVRAPEVRVVAGLGSPVLWCLGRTRLLVPEELMDRLPAERWPSLLVHELAHCRRRDPWVCRLVLLAECLWWWDPVFWLVRRRLHLEAELACDAWVVWALPEGRRTYAETLIDVCEHITRSATPAPALGVGRAGRTLQRRLTMILHERVKHRLTPWGLLTVGLLAVLSMPVWTLGQQGDKSKPNEPGRDPRREQSVNNLKMIGLAFHNYYAMNDRLPPAAIRGRDGKPLLSWRVAILPFLEQQALFNEFHLDEPWDSPHNKALVAKMPAVYALPGWETKSPPGLTFYQGLVGAGTVFEDERGARLAEITDGTSNTLMVVEAAAPVPWTQPEDVAYNAVGSLDGKRPVPNLGGLFGDEFNALFCDGSVRRLPRDINPTTFRALVTTDGGEVISAEALGTAPGLGQSVHFGRPVISAEALGTAPGSPADLSPLEEMVRAKRAELAAIEKQLRAARQSLKERQATPTVPPSAPLAPPPPLPPAAPTELPQSGGVTGGPLSPAPTEAAWPAHTAKVGDRIIVEVLEALPGRPITGERPVRSDGTISLGWYGDVCVVGLTRRQIKEKIVQHLRKYINDATLGLVLKEEDPKNPDGPPRVTYVDPADTDRVYVDDEPPPTEATERRLDELERKLDEVLRALNQNPRLGRPGSRR